MDVPERVPAEPTLLRERWGWPTIAMWAALSVLALVVPGTTALVLRPENPGEGYLALALAALALAWQAYRLTVAAIEIGPAGIRRRGLRSRVTPWGQVHDLRWRTTPAVAQMRRSVPLHRLHMTTDRGVVTLTRYPLRDAQAQEVAQTIGAWGIPLPMPAPGGDGPS